MAPVIIPAYVDGVNAYIAETERNPDLLPIEFELLGIRPKPWTPDVVISRHQGLLGNIGSELDYGRAVAAVGAEAVKRVANFHPREPDIDLDPAIDGSLLNADILGLYNAFRRPVQFRRDHLVEEYRGDQDAIDLVQLAGGDQPGASGVDADPFTAWQDQRDIGSNNWVVSGRLSESGYPLMANDPHRAQSVPSLRYWVHLVGPGWNVHRRRGARDPRGLHRPQRAWGVGADRVLHRRGRTSTSTRPTPPIPTGTGTGVDGKR